MAYVLPSIPQLKPLARITGKTYRSRLKPYLKIWGLSIVTAVGSGTELCFGKRSRDATHPYPQKGRQEFPAGLF